MNFEEVAKQVEKSTPIAKSSAGHIKFLDHFRGAAILLVCLFHAFKYSTSLHTGVHPDAYENIPMSRFTSLVLSLFSQGWIGVPIFFVVSGFCIHLSHVKSKEIGFKTFFIRRFFRIYPPYFIALLFFGIFFSATRLAFSSWTDFADWMAHVLLLHNLSPLSIYTTNGSFWSIAVEAQLYLLYPLVFWLARKWGWRNSLVLLLACESSVNLLVYCFPKLPPHLIPWFQWTEFSPFRYWFSWTVGAVIADDWMAKRKIFLSRWPLWVWPVALAVCFLSNLHHFRFTFAALSAATLMARLLGEAGVVKRLLALPLLPFVQWIGVISYSAYLIHQPVMAYASDLIRQIVPGLAPYPLPTFVLLVLLVLPPILLVSWGFYLWVELPSIALGKRLLHWQKGRRSIPLATV